MLPAHTIRLQGDRGDLTLDDQGVERLPRGFFSLRIHRLSKVTWVPDSDQVRWHCERTRRLGQNETASLLLQGSHRGPHYAAPGPWMCSSAVLNSATLNGFSTACVPDRPRK